jgi:hypothetical protein
MCQDLKTFKSHDFWQFSTHFASQIYKKNLVFGGKKSYFLNISKV